MSVNAARGIAVAVLIALGVAAAPASASISPTNTAVTATSSNANLQIFGFINMTCNSGLRFTTPPSGNGPVGLTGDAPPATPRFNGCNIGTVFTTSGWTVAATPVTSSTNTLTFQVPLHGAVITGTICGGIATGSATVTAAYTDGSSTVTVNPSSVPFTSTFCGSGNATFTANYSLSTWLYVTP